MSEAKVEQELRTRIALKYGQQRGILLSREELAAVYRLIQHVDLAAHAPRAESAEPTLAKLRRCPACGSADIIANGDELLPFRCVTCWKPFAQGNKKHPLHPSTCLCEDCAAEKWAARPEEGTVNEEKERKKADAEFDKRNPGVYLKGTRGSFRAGWLARARSEGR